MTLQEPPLRALRLQLQKGSELAIEQTNSALALVRLELQLTSLVVSSSLGCNGFSSYSPIADCCQIPRVDSCPRSTYPVAA